MYMAVKLSKIAFLGGLSMEALKSERLSIQVTPEQKRLIKDAAKAVGLTVSGYVLYSTFERIGEQLGQNILDAMDAKRQDSEP